MPVCYSLVIELFQQIFSVKAAKFGTFRNESCGDIGSCVILFIKGQ